MSDKFNFRGLKDKAIKNMQSIDVDAIKEKAVKAGDIISDKAMEVKDSAVSVRDDITDKLTELDRMLESSITEYNDAYTLMNDKGVQLFMERNRSTDVLTLVETLVNSIANRPKSFEKEFEEIRLNRDTFRSACEFGERELQAARDAASGAGAGLAAGASVAFMAPSAAMWVATTFGTASTGTAISTLSGIAAQKAALAWLGGGALTTGGHGIAGGSALLAMSGPIGWSIAGATLLTSILLFTKKRTNLNKQKNEEIESVKRNTEKVKEVDAELKELLGETIALREGVNDSFTGSLDMFGKEYSTFSDDQKRKLGTLVNNTKALSALLGKVIE
ncbi:MAG: hypothetical protein IJH81_05270 [Lachnospiraceae bacterium]|nr:hypothetical protein [Lachnospiraceae bacterium]